jgi:hypothetical protein
MQNDKYEEALKQYLAAITLTTSQAERIESTLENVIALMLTAFPDAEVYAQGSYSTDTMAKPLTHVQSGGSPGEFDIDIVVEREVWDGAVDALDAVATVIEEDSVYGRMPIDKTKNTCIRIDYAADGGGVGFHIDLVPTKLGGGARSVPHREDDIWKPSDAKQFADWFNGRAQDQSGIRSIAVILKRLRDLNGLTDNLRSILILTLVEQKYYRNGTIMGDLLKVLDGINDLMSSDTNPPFIANPVNTGENLSDGLSDYTAVRTFFKATKDRLTTTIAEDDAEALKEIFGSAFNYTAVEQAKATTFAATPVRPTRAFGVNDATSNEV